jgi:hypothetical protein
MPNSKKAQTRTFRIDPTLLGILDSEAEEQGITSSSLINQILKKYALVGRYEEKDEVINISHDAMKLMVEQLTKEELLKVGSKAGSELSSNYFYMMDKKDVESVISFMNLQLGKYNNWYQLHSSVENKKYTLLLSHQLEIKWSLWLQGLMETFLKNILNAQVNTEVLNNSVIITFNLS